MRRIFFTSLLGLSLIAFVVSGTLSNASYAYAQQSTNSLITLDDSSPTANVVVTLDNNAPGVVYVEMNGAQATVTDTVSPDTLVIRDKRVSAFSFQLRQGAPTHILRLERLTGVPSAQVYIQAEAALPPIIGASQAVSFLASGATGSTSATMHVAPAAMVPVTISGSSNMLSVQFADQPETMQLFDGSGTIILTKDPDNALGGLTINLAPGQYNLSIANSDPSTQSDIHLGLSTPPTSQLALLAPAATPTIVPCSAHIVATTVNLRSGPGVGYSILGYGYQNDVMVVGGVNSQGGWLLVQTKVGAAWVSAQTVATNGNCSGLTAFNIPLRGAPVSVTVTAQPNPVVIVPPAGGAGGSGGGGGNDDGQDHGGQGD